MFGSFWFTSNVDLPKEAALQKIPGISGVFRRTLQFEKQVRRAELLVF